MYESPINAYFGEVETQFDDAVFKAIQRVGIGVNKDELIKALAYDREQYERGYHDGLMFHPTIITNADRIRAMTDEELAKFLWDVWRRKDPLYKECVDGWIVPFYHWLKEEAQCTSE